MVQCAFVFLVYGEWKKNQQQQQQHDQFHNELQREWQQMNGTSESLDCQMAMRCCKKKVYRDGQSIVYIENFPGELHLVLPACLPTCRFGKALRMCVFVSKTHNHWANVSMELDFNFSKPQAGWNLLPHIANIF